MRLPSVTATGRWREWGELSVTGEDIHIWIMELTTRILSRLTSDPGSDLKIHLRRLTVASLAFTGDRPGVNTIIKKG